MKVVIEYSIYIAILYLFSDSDKLKKVLIYSVYLHILLVVLVDVLAYNEGLIGLVDLIVEDIMLSILSSLFIYKMITSSQVDTNITGKYIFWVAYGLLIRFGGELILFAYVIFLSYGDNIVFPFPPVNTMRNVLAFFTYIVYIIALSCPYPTKQYR
ncbi:hypothetical protein [Spirosoma pulveris]